MDKFNTYLDLIDTELYKNFCMKYGEARLFKRKELYLRAGDICSTFGYIKEGCFKYTCINTAENRLHSIGFSFKDEFISDYPTCKYGIPSKINIEALTDSEVYIVDIHTFIKHIYFINKETELIKASDGLFLQSYERYINLYTQTPEERYHDLLKRCPEILQFISLKELASFLRITPIYLSKIRRKTLSQ